jgi:CRP/FNR family transcriptional regulator
MTVSVERRVARALLVLERTVGRAGAGGVEIPMPLNRQDLADLGGTTIETAIRIMSRWGKEGIVLTLGHGFLIPDLARLQAIADG